MTERDYPTEAELRKIRRWKVDPIDVEETKKLLNFIKSIWWAKDWGWHETRHRVYCSTGGWSGNESLIEAFRKNRWAWYNVWYSSRRGGHYIFEFRRRK